MAASKSSAAIPFAERGLLDTEGWADLRSVLLVEAEGMIGDQVSLKRRLFIGVANKRLRAGWDEAYLRKIIQQI